MPEPRSFTVALKTVLVESAWPWVIAALRQDALVWETIQEPDLAERALTEIGNQPEGWNPAALAFLALGQPASACHAPLDPLLRQRAFRAYESLVRQAPSSPGEPPSLAHAGLLAITLAEHRQVSGSWSNLPSDLSPLPTDSPAFAAWQTPLAILYGLAADRLELLAQLVFPGAPLAFQEAAIHAMLSNPLPLQEQAQVFGTLLRDLPLTEAGLFLRLIDHQHPGLAAWLARRLLDHQATLPSPRRSATGLERLGYIGQLLYNAEIHALAVQSSQAVALRTLALHQTRGAQLEIASQLAASITIGGDLPAALRAWQSVSPEIDGALPPTRLILALLEAGRSREALALLPDNQATNPLYLLATAHLVFDEGDQDHAREFARQSLRSTLEHIRQPDVEQGGEPSGLEEAEPATHALPTELDFLQISRALVGHFLDLSLPDEAVRAAQLALHLQPNDPELLGMLALSFRLAGESAAAVEAAHLAVALEATNPALRRELAASLEAAGDWQAALSERKALLDGQMTSQEGIPSPTPEDLRSLASCALSAGQPEQAVEACQAALQIDTEDGLAHAALGEALSILGQPEAAFDHFRLATQHAPHQPHPWLALARAQGEAGQPAKAVETLRAAAHAVPGDPAIHLALAESFLAEEALTQALSTLKRAHEIASLPGRLRSGKGSPSLGQALGSGGAFLMDRAVPSRIALLLGQTLHRLGRLTEASQVLCGAYQAHRSYPGLAYAYAQTLLELDQPGAALAPLAAAVNAGQADPKLYLDYARALLAANAQPEEAVRVLRKALELAPLTGSASLSTPGEFGDVAAHGGLEEKDSPVGGWNIALSPTVLTALALLAEALAASGDLESALQAYYRVLETGLVDDPAWRARLSLGLGQVALRLDQPETAVAALEEAARADPLNASILQALSEAYESLRLPKESLEAARASMQLAPDDVNTLLWFADQAIHLGELAEALPPLNRAVQLEPQRMELFLLLGQVHTRLGDDNAALKSFRQIVVSTASDPGQLQQAAGGLLELGDTASAIACLERALEALPAPTPALLRKLADIQQRSGATEQALETLDRAIQLEPHDPGLHLFKADLLLVLERPEAAQACLEHALNLHPGDPEIHQRMVQVLRGRGELAAALSFAEQMLAAFNQSPETPQVLFARAQVADLYRAVLLPERARELLARTAAGETTELGPGLPALFYCLAAELALEQEEEVAAAEALTLGFELEPDRPRVLALQARFAQRRGDATAALQSLQAGLEAIGAHPQDFQNGQAPGDGEIEDGEDGSDATSASTHEGTLRARPAVLEQTAPAQDLHGLAYAALELFQWDTGLYLLRQAAALAPHEPWSHMQLARALALRAEYQRLCQSMEVQAHAPGAAALAGYAYQLFKNAIQAAQDCLPGEILAPAVEQEGDEPGPHPLLPPPAIQRWNARGEIAFQIEKATPHSLKILSTYPEDRAAYIAALGAAGDLVAINRQYQVTQERSEANQPEGSLVLAQLALALGFLGRRQEDMKQALAAARSAIDRQPNQPLYHILHARLAQAISDWPAALASIQNALSLWPDEPRWQALAANIHQAAGDTPAAIQHLSRAAALEPRRLAHHLALGEAYLQAGDTHHAVRALEGAARIAPHQVEPFLALAHAYQSFGDLGKAANSAENAIMVAPDQVAPLQLRAEIALKLGDPRNAHKRAEAALLLQPDDPATLHLSARALEKLGRTGEALAMLEKAIPLAAEPLTLKLERARLLENQGGVSGSLPALMELAADYPDEPAVLARLAKAQAAAGQKETATQTAQRALRYNGTLNPVEQAGLHHLLGRLLWQAGQLDQATHHINEATRLDPDELEAYLDLGSLQQARRQQAQAMLTYQQAIAVAPRDYRPYYQAGSVLKANRDYLGAENMLRRAAELAPNDLSIHRQLAALVALNLVHNRRPVPQDA